MANIGTVNIPLIALNQSFGQINGSTTKAWPHRLAGNVTVNGAVAQKRILVIDRQGRFLATTFSDQTTGNWEITHLPERVANAKLTVLAMDDSGTYNAEVADSVEPVN